jgi:Acetyltransferase (GNAT) domain
MIRIVNPLTYPDWNNVLFSCPGASFFHTSTWANVLKKSYHYEPRYLTMEENGTMAVLPIMEVNSPITGRRGVSLPFSDYCEPIVSDDDQFEKIFAYICNYGKKNGWRYIEIRGGQKFLDNNEPSECYFGHTLDLTKDIEKIFSNLRDSTKRNIKKAEKDGVQVVISYSLDSMNQFYRLNCLTRREHGLPPQPYYFFKNIHDEIILKHLGFISLASHENIAIAGNVYFLFGEKAIYKYGASDRTYQHFRANNLVMSEAIKWCREKGYRELCFGRTETDNDGLRQFKSGWGTREQIIKYYKYDFQKHSFTRRHPHISVFQHTIFNKMPIPMLNALGNLLYKHMG